MLEIIKYGAPRTQLIHKANLSSNQLNGYLSFLLNRHLIKKTVEADKEGFLITNDGVDFLQRHNELKKMLKTTKIIL
jgi:predicted transcriptional regulator